jgi:penicillin-insensitive murein DD-endopeptidase
MIKAIHHLFDIGVVLICLVGPSLTLAAESQCFGTVANGRLEGGVKLPARGSNFSAYSAVGVAAGRTNVHSKVAEIISTSYAALALSNPDVAYVYGETGWPSGGRFQPHRTHQNGLSVDFFVPVRDESGRSVPLPANIANRFGYDIEFDPGGRTATYSIDFPAMAEHLYQLHVAAQTRGTGIALVIFDPVLLPLLFSTSRGRYLQQHLRFMKGQAWVRHDEHYHVDFNVPCKALSGDRF